MSSRAHRRFSPDAANILFSRGPFASIIRDFSFRQGTVEPPGPGCWLHLYGAPAMAGLRTIPPSHRTALLARCSGGAMALGARFKTHHLLRLQPAARLRSVSVLCTASVSNWLESTQQPAKQQPRRLRRRPFRSCVRASTALSEPSTQNRTRMLPVPHGLPAEAAARTKRCSLQLRTRQAREGQTARKVVVADECHYLKTLAASHSKIRVKHPLARRGRHTSALRSCVPRVFPLRARLYPAPTWSSFKAAMVRRCSGGYDLGVAQEKVKIIISVTPCRLMATGVDGFQNFISILVKLGELFTAKETE
ncbi:hypothetical protein TPAR_08521 [Tolypocladium paradoxum]|uniref:Uncharacterized protein n=1 Tax=Tolypocladium paradoxum TaxID=94208 RepID=A0A2S4KME7_9HYPO|nr:hypothetical protein TPAR_08521 [Tolypocladium paradoxum]